MLPCIDGKKELSGIRTWNKKKIISYIYFMKIRDTYIPLRNDNYTRVSEKYYIWSRQFFVSNHISFVNLYNFQFKLIVRRLFVLRRCRFKPKYDNLIIILMLIDILDRIFHLNTKSVNNLIVKNITSAGNRT